MSSGTFSISQKELFTFIQQYEKFDFSDIKQLVYKSSFVVTIAEVTCEIGV